MQLIDGRPVFSASDLVGYLACEHLTNLERAAMAGLVTRPDRNDPELDVIRRRGFEHEKRFLAELVARGRHVTEIAADGSVEDHGERLRRAADETAAAMRRGEDVIYQATFFDGRWRGHADFLVRVDLPSAFGAHSYEVYDTKLAHHVKAAALVQICSYIDQLTAIQRVQPEWMYVALGGSERAVERFRVADHMAYYRAARSRFEAAALREQPPAYPPAETYPEPVEHCEVCRWYVECVARRRADDHLSLVAGISAHQRRALTGRGVTTLEQLGGLTLPMNPPLEGVGAAALMRTREQARLQDQGRRAGRMLHELLRPPEPERGLASLPPPSYGDLFFDIEGDPYALDDGLEYLFGVIEPSRTDASGDPVFHRFWGTDRAGEKAAFEQLIDLLMDRLARDPQLHVYHYAGYEPTAVKRLMGRHATREDEVDRLLRGGVFVDLLRAVRQGLRASVESYSIKAIEPLYGFRREVDLRDAGSSIVAFETWLELSEGEAGGDPAILERIELYNRDDCLSNWRLREWLEARRVELEQLAGQPVPRPQPRGADPSEVLGARLAEVQALVERLTAGVPAEPTERTADEQGRWLLAQLLGWHRREDKSFWWLYYHLMDDLTDEERVDENEPIGCLTYEGVIDEEKQSYVHRYRFPPQEHDISAGPNTRDPATRESPGTVVAIDDARGTIDIKRSKKSDKPHPTSLVPFLYYGTDEIQDSLMRVGAWVADNGIGAPGAYQSARDLLLRLAPRAGQDNGTPLAAGGEPALTAARRLALALDRTTLPIQGPPGSGKTYTGARMILSLIAAGRRVGITATAHKVISNLLDEVMEAASSEGVAVRAIQKADDEQCCRSEDVRKVDSNPEVVQALAEGEVNLVAGTAWLWSREDMAGAVDVLFVDEAGQFSLANAVAVAGGAASLVLLGDPLQLDQPLQGVHPPGAERSALAHVLGGAATMPPEAGLFLERTWRLHPDLCRFTSEAFYEGRLEPEPTLAAQRLDAAAWPGGTGLRHVAVAHRGNQNESQEEADAVAQIVNSLVETGSTWTDSAGATRPLRLEDVVVVAPYNAQVAAIAKRLPRNARVGTVDKFQGQEAPVSIYSMATSTPEDAPRGMRFLYSRHRLNVATSRARCLAILVCSPDLLRVRARAARDIPLANALCQLVEMATPPGG